MKSVLISIQPYYIFLIIAKVMGWNIDKRKTVEVRKNIPKDSDWNKRAIVYCSRNKKSFNQIPKEYQPLMQAFLGKVIGEFVCDKIDNKHLDDLIVKEDCERALQGTCLTKKDILAYLSYTRGTDIRQNYKMWCFYGWHISDLKIYDKPKEISEFIKPYRYDGDGLRCCTKEELEDIYEWDCETLFNNKYPNFDFENCKCEDCPKAKDFYRLTRPPQNWCYVKEDLW